MVAGRSPGWYPHPVLPQGTGETDLAGGGRYLGVLVIQLLLDESPGVVRVPHSLGLQLLEEVLVSETLHGVDRDCEGLAVLGSPADGQSVVRAAGQLDKVCDVEGAWGTSGLCAGLAGQRVGQGADLTIDLKTHTVHTVHKHCTYCTHCRHTLYILYTH